MKIEMSQQQVDAAIREDAWMATSWEWVMEHSWRHRAMLGGRVRGGF